MRVALEDMNHNHCNHAAMATASYLHLLFVKFQSSTGSVGLAHHQPQTKAAAATLFQYGKYA